MTLEGLSLWSLGALFGLRHALEPDHLAAVSTLVAHRPGSRTALGLGASWGLGHTLALVAVASVLAAARRTLPPTLGSWFELGVGVMLITLGLQAVCRARAAADRAWPPTGPRSQADVVSTDPPGASPPASGAAPRPAWSPARRALLVGVVHGLAGSGALAALIAARFPSLAGRVAYVGLFGLGSMIGMATLSGLAGVSLARAGRGATLTRTVGVAAGAVAIALGILWTGREIRWLAG